MTTLITIMQNQTERHKEWYIVLEKLKNGERVDGDHLEFLIYEGIPDSIRGIAWPILSKIDQKAGNAQKIMRLLDTKLSQPDLN